MNGPRRHAPIPVTIRTEEIDLGSFLKLAGAVLTGGEAKGRVQRGEVRVNDQTELHRRRSLRPGDRVSIPGGLTYVVHDASTGLNHP